MSLLQRSMMIARGLAKWLLVALAGATALLFLALAVLQIGPVRQTLLQYGLTLINNGGLDVQADDIGGTWPYRLTFQNLRVADMRGEWLVVQSADMAWQPFSLLAGNLHIVSLHVKDLTLSRVPDGGAASASRETGLLPQLPVNVEIDAFALEDMKLAREVLGEAMRFDAAGEARYGPLILLKMLADRRDGIKGHIDADISFDEMLRVGRGQLLIEDGGSGHQGLLAQLADMPELSALKMMATGEARDGVMTAAVQVDAAQGLQAKADIHGQVIDGLDLHFDADALGQLVARQTRDLGGGDRAHARGKAALDADGQLVLSELDLRAGALAMTGEARLGAAKSDQNRAIKGAGRITGLNRLVTGRDSNLMADMGWEVEGSGSLESNQFTFTTAHLVSDASDIRFVGDIDAADGFSMRGDVHALLMDVAPLAELAELDLHGRGEARLSPFALDKDGSAAADITLTLAPMQSSDPLMTGLLGRGLTGESSLMLSSGGEITLPAIDVAAPDQSLRLKGNLTLGRDEALGGRIAMQLSDAARALPGAQMSGKLSFEARLSGQLDAPSGELQAVLENGTVIGLDARKLTLNLKADAGQTGPFDLSLTGKDGKATAHGMIALPEEGGVVLSAIEADLFGADVTGDLRVLSNGHATGQLVGDNMSLRPLGVFAGVAARGRGDLRVRLTNEGGTQNADLSLASDRMTMALAKPLTLEKVLLKAALHDPGGKHENVQASLHAESGMGGVTQLSRISAQADGPLDNLALSLDVEGHELSLSPKPVSLTAKAIYAPDRLNLQSLHYQIADASLTLAAPLSVALTKGVQFEAADFATNGAQGAGHVRGDLALNGRSAKGGVDIDALPIALLAPLMPIEQADGAINGKADLDSARGFGNVALSFHQVRLTQTDLTQAPAFDATLDGSWAKGRLRFAARALGNSEIPFTLDGAVPMIRDPAGAFPMLATRGPVQGSLRWQGPLASLMALADLPGHKLSGLADLSLRASGDIAAPLIDGNGSITNGTYENYQLGTLLRDLTVTLNAQRSEAVGFEMSANDSGKGRMTSRGQVNLARDAASALQVEITFDNAQLVRERDLDMALSGTVAMRATKLPFSAEAPLRVSGGLETKLLQYRIPEKLPSHVPEIAVVEINGGRQGGRTRDVTTEEALPVVLDLTIKLAEAARVSGRGLTSLWTGEFSVGGMAEAPQLQGRLNALRGAFDLGGKTFALTRGQVIFEGHQPIEPRLDLLFTHERSDLTATIAVTGTSNAPKITLASTPSLPRDEIISRVLFEKGVGELTAVEAAQLANTLAVVSGQSGGGPDILGKLQDSLGLDVLSLDKGASGATTVSAGKYIRKGVYVGVQQGASASDSAIKVEIEVTPRVSVDTKIGQSATSDVGVNWKWDY